MVKTTKNKTCTRYASNPSACKKTRGCSYVNKSRKYCRRSTRGVCAGKTMKRCKSSKKRCSYASGTQRQFCRVKKNTRKH